LLDTRRRASKEQAGFSWKILSPMSLPAAQRRRHQFHRPTSALGALSPGGIKHSRRWAVQERESSRQLLFDEASSSLCGRRFGRDHTTGKSFDPRPQKRQALAFFPASTSSLRALFSAKRRKKAFSPLSIPILRLAASGEKIAAVSWPTNIILARIWASQTILRQAASGPRTKGPSCSKPLPAKG